MSEKIIGGLAMRKKYLNWKNTLSELNDFSCKIEFLQCKMRNMIACQKFMDIDKYLISLRKLLSEHEHKLHLAEFENNREIAVEQIRNRESKLPVKLIHKNMVFN